MAKAVIIMGMHRSGTSALAQCLMDSGLSFDLPSIADGFWPKHVEYYLVNKLNDKILGSWKEPLRSQNLLRDALSRLRVGLFVKKHFPGDSWVGLKDPRMLLTYDLWLPHFSEFKLLGVFRRPEEVARSLSIRDEYGRASFDAGLELWRQHNAALLELRAAHEFPILDYNTPKEEFGRNLQAACESLAIPYAPQAFDATFSDEKRHHEAHNIPDACAEVYSKLLSYSAQNIRADSESAS